MASARVRDIVVPNWTYAVSGKHDHALVPTDIYVRCTSAPKPLVVLPHEALPFGLLESIAIQPCDDLTVPDYRLHVMKTTGMRISPRVQSGQAVDVTLRDMANNEDAADEDLRALVDATGHVMQHRMIAGSSVMGLAVEFYGPAPNSFDVVYHGANAIPKNVEVDKVRRKLAARESVPFMYRPMRPTQRLEKLKPRLEARSAEAV